MHGAEVRARGECHGWKEPEYINDARTEHVVMNWGPLWGFGDEEKKTHIGRRGVWMSMYSPQYCDEQAEKKENMRAGWCVCRILRVKERQKECGGACVWGGAAG
jgi:hypothetical protein